MSGATFYWFDYETWGISPQWDRPAQFAGVRTDEQLNPIGKPEMFYCQLPPDYLPDPGACKVTRLLPEFVQANGLTEPEFMKKVLQLLGAKGTCSVGYNSIRFDDEVTRHALFRNFHDPYRHEWHDGNSRWDLLDVVRMTRALRPEGIEWPVNEDGKANNKLENLTAVNGLSHEQAHDALSDVYATIAVAKLIKQAQPKLYEFALTLRRKATVAKLLNWQNMKPVVHVTGMVPSERSHTSIVVPLMRHPTNSNGIIVLDMRTDPLQLLGLNQDQIQSKLYQRDLPAEERLHLRTIHINRCPMVAPISTLNPADAERIGLDLNAELERANQVSRLGEEQLKVIGQALDYSANEHTLRVEQAVARCPEASLYNGGFLSDSDRRRATQVTNLQPSQLIGFEESNGYFDDTRLQKLLLNYRARNALKTLSEEELNTWQADCSERLHEESNAVPWSTFSHFDDAMANTEWDEHSTQLKASLMKWRKRVSDYLSKPCD